MTETADILVRTGFLPATIKTPQQAVAIMLKGRELGVPAMYALSNIVVIQGKPTCNAELMLALIFRDHGDEAIHFAESTTQRCTIEFKRRTGRPGRLSYTIEDAKAAGLLSNQTWQKYPSAMLRARCISAVARMAFADSIGGMYTPEELGATVSWDEATGETVVDMPPAARRVVVSETGEIVDQQPFNAGGDRPYTPPRPAQTVPQVQLEGFPEHEPTHAPGTAAGQGDSPSDAEWDVIPSASSGEATEKQVKAIFAIGKKSGWEAKRVEEECVERYGVMPRELTKAEASQYITMLNERMNEVER